MWQEADAYERYMGRWSRLVARTFLDRLSLPQGLRWVDVGCGVGTLTQVVLERCEPSAVLGIDASPAFVAYARARIDDPRMRFEQGRAEELPLGNATVDVAVSGLAINFFSDPARAVSELRRVVRPGGVVAGYVWDYDYEDFFLTRFWAAVDRARNDRASGDERQRSPVCSLDGLHDLAVDSGLRDVGVWPIVVDTRFSSVEELWGGYLLGVGPSGSCAVGLDEPERARVREHLEEALPVTDAGVVMLTARAFALSARTPQ